MIFLRSRLQIDATAAAAAAVQEWAYLLPPLAMAACLGRFAWMSPLRSCAAAASAISAPLVAAWVLKTAHAQLALGLLPAADHSDHSQHSMLGNSYEQPSLLVVALLTVVAACLVDVAQLLVAASRAACHHLPPLHRAKLHGQTSQQPQPQPASQPHPVTSCRRPLSTINRFQRMYLQMKHRCRPLSVFKLHLW